MRIGDFKETYSADEAIFRTPPCARGWGRWEPRSLVFPLVAGDYLLYLANLTG